MASRGAGSSEPHFLLLPYVAQSHINPMLSLASHLLALGCRVTFVKADQRAELTSANVGEEGRRKSEEGGEDQVPERLHFVSTEEEHESASNEKSAADHVSSEEEKENKLLELKNLLWGLEERQGRLVARLLRESGASSPHPFSGIICDFFMWKWASPLSRSHGVPLAVLTACSATSFYVLYLQHKRKYGEVKDLLVSGFGLPTSEFLADGFSTSKDAPAVIKETTNFFLDLYEGFDEAGHLVVVNSFHHLEAPLLPHLEASPLEFTFVGPCFPVWSTDLIMRMAQHAGSPFLEEQSCMPWLDKQEKGSVLFVAFGSVAALKDEAQMEEIAVGIEKSGYKILWILRPDAPKVMLPPKAFRERINRSRGEVGMFVEWAPQKRVLQHPAVGGFLTHNGWNSTMESVTYGMPMLCVPLFFDQPLIANMVQWYWKLGMRLERSAKSGMVGREEVERGVHNIMQGRHTYPCIAEYQKAAQSAIANGPRRLASFVRSMTGRAACMAQ